MAYRDEKLKDEPKQGRLRGLIFLRQWHGTAFFALLFFFCHLTYRIVWCNFPLPRLFSMSSLMFVEGLFCLLILLIHVRPRYYNYFPTRRPLDEEKEDEAT